MSGMIGLVECTVHLQLLPPLEHSGGKGHWGRFRSLLSQEGVPQGDPLAMIAYGIGVLPLIREIRGAHTRVTQPWYSDDAGAGLKFMPILAHLRDLQERGLSRGHFPDPTKSILVVAPQNVSGAEEFFQGMGLKVVTGSRYLGGLIKDIEAEKIWLGGRVVGWVESVETLTGVSRKHLYSAYAGLHNLLQQEWVFVQRVTPE